jgi:predicted dehydrogenase
MTRGLIIGYGRAGKRHGQMLDELGIEIYIYDPLVYSDFFYQNSGITDEVYLWKDKYHHGLKSIFSKHTFDFAVIATPPDLHLAQLRQCLDAGLPVLCEKPLCGLGQLAEAEALLQHPNAGSVMVAYNYRWHPRLITPNGLPEMMVCRQQRDLPAWGLLLDHCSHDLDIMRSQTGGELHVISASHHKNHKYEWWTIDCEARGQQIMIEEWVGPSNKRVAKIAYADHVVEIDADPEMFREMWSAFLNGNYAPGLAEAIETQKLLERCKELAG